ncbi:MAG: M48 family metalloprotease [Pseudomonadota bacterium]
MASARDGRARVSRALCGVIAGAFAATALMPVHEAEARGFRFIRDTELEDLLRDYSRPILRVAGLQDRVRMRIINNPSFNAFVVNGRSIFMNSGALMQAETPNAVIGVIAHEAGHITGGHIAGLQRKLKRDSNRLLLAQILGVGALIAGGTAGNKNTGEVVGGIGRGLLGGSSTVLQRSIFKYRRAQESSADQAAIEFLDKTGQSARGMLETFEFLAQTEMFTSNVQSIYNRSHPLPQRRIALLRSRAQASDYYNRKDPPELQLRHDLMRAKLAGYLENARTVFNKYPESDRSLPAIYARAIASSELGDWNSAVPRARALQKKMPRNAYFHELEGEILFRAGRPREAIPPLQRALKIRKRAPLIQIRLAQSMLATNDPRYRKQVIALLSQATVKEKGALPFRLLARAYAADGRQADAQLAAAQAFLFEGKRIDAQRQALRAQKAFPRNSRKWNRASEIIRIAKRR